MQTPTARKRYERTLYTTVLVLQEEGEEAQPTQEKFSNADER